MIGNPDTSVVEMDTIISAGDCKKVLLTLHFVIYHFHLAYILPNKESDTINSLCTSTGIEYYKRLLKVILTDNGTEFSDPKVIEIEPETAELRTKVFFCHPYRSGKKEHCEKKHKYIRYILSKRTVFDFLTQDKCDLMISHVNSTKRPSINGTPYDFMALTYGTIVLDLLKIKKIDSNIANQIINQFYHY